MSKPRNIKGQYVKEVWTEEQLKVLREKYPFTKAIDIAKIIQRSYRSVLNKAHELGIKKDPAFLRNCGHQLQSHQNCCRFSKGHTPFNKGKKKIEYLSEEKIEQQKSTCFKKGHKPHNTVPIGSETTDIYGYRKIKVGEPNKWEYIHRLVYKERYGDIPKNAVIRFKDGNKQNCSIDNLKQIDRAENAIRNSIHRYPEEVKTAIRRIGKLNKIIKSQQNGKEN